jgi:hypothetical protein
LQFDHGVSAHHRLEIIEWIRVLAIAQDQLFVRWIRITDAQAQHETVQLRLRQRIRAVMFDRVLRGEHDERRGQSMRRAFNGDVSFGHRFEQRRLGFRRGAIDLVGEHDVGENRSGFPLENAAVLVVNGKSDDVGRQ